MSKATITDYEKRLCISYLDEVEAFKGCEHFLKAMVSFTALKSNYITDIETRWKALRDAYNIKSGLCLHFSDIKYLLSGNTRKYNADFYDIFKDVSGNIDNGKLHRFYNDILVFIRDNTFVFQATGIKAPRRTHTIIPKIDMNSIMYQLFSEHLDRMGFYMIHLTIEEFKARESALRAAGETKKLSNLEPNFFFTKLRYDGNYVLTERNDYRNAFSHCISDGTKHFNSNIIKEVFDNLNFVSKAQVGQAKVCATPCDIDVISHAGAEIVDFAALYITRYIWKDFFRDYEIHVKSKNPAVVDDEMERNCMIVIPGYPVIDPMSIIHNKMFENADVAKYKKIEDYPF